MAVKLARHRIAACRHAGRKLKYYYSVAFSYKIVKLRNINRLLTALLRSYKDPSTQVEIQQSLTAKLALLDFIPPPICRAEDQMSKLTFKF